MHKPRNKWMYLYKFWKFFNFDIVNSPWKCTRNNLSFQFYIGSKIKRIYIIINTHSNETPYFPQSSEFTATFIGRLVTTLIRKAGSTLGSNLDLLLKAVLSKMQRTETSTVMQSLLMIYAHLINSEFDAVLNFLSTVPGPSGESALVFVLTEWVSKQQLFFGSYDRKVSTVALCKLLEYGVTQDDMRLNEIMVDGDLVYLGENDWAGFG